MFSVLNSTVQHCTEHRVLHFVFLHGLGYTHFTLLGVGGSSVQRNPKCIQRKYVHVLSFFRKLQSSLELNGWVGLGPFFNIGKEMSFRMTSILNGTCPESFTHICENRHHVFARRRGWAAFSFFIYSLWLKVDVFWFDIEGFGLVA